MIRILLDSSADFSAQEVKERNLELVPINITLNGKNYLDGVDITKDEFYTLLTENEEFPKTAQPSPQDYVDIFEDAKEISLGKIFLSQSEEITVIPGGFCFETNGVTLLYIFEECDIMDIEPKFRRADITVLDGISPEKFPFLRCDYLILTEMGGFYSGTSEIITLKNGEQIFFAYEGNLKKGGAAK